MRLGHVARFAPVARRLLAAGHEVAAVVRGRAAAESFLAPLGIACRQAPRCRPASGAAAPLASHADILLAQGWADSQALHALVGAWQAHFAAWRPQAIVLDHAPGAGLAACLGDWPSLRLGNGFEIPPWPWPAFPGGAPADRERVAAATERCLEAARGVAQRLAVAAPASLAEIFESGPRCLMTLPELDHYGPRPGEDYLGPCWDADPGRRVDWPPGGGSRVFAVLRGDARRTAVLLDGLARCGAAVLCVAPELDPAAAPRSDGGQITVLRERIDLRPLLATADACLSYGAEGTTARFLLAGVPQVLAPEHVEAALAATRIEALGAAFVLRGPQTPASVAAALRHTLESGAMRDAARRFAAQHRHHTPQRAAAGAARRILERAASARSQPPAPTASRLPYPAPS